MLCIICGIQIMGESIGAGDGTGQKFAHPACYYKREYERVKAELATLKAESVTPDW